MVRSENNGLNVTITESARHYLSELLKKQKCEGIAIRMFVSDPGTPKAETCLAYCRPGEEQDGDILIEFGALNVFFEAKSVPYLGEALIDYLSDKMGGRLSINAPNSRLPKVTDDSSMEGKINFVLHSEINPGLVSHGGNVSLVEVTEDNYALLEFGGGCQGCYAVDLTLKGGVEKTLMEKIPGLVGVRDVTDHADTSKAYFK